jgi:hypothetical protein
VYDFIENYGGSLSDEVTIIESDVQVTLIPDSQPGETEKIGDNWVLNGMYAPKSNSQSNGRLLVGDVLTVQQLIDLAVVQSAGDACLALARYVEGYFPSLTDTTTTYRTAFRERVRQKTGITIDSIHGGVDTTNFNARSMAEFTRKFVVDFPQILLVTKQTNVTITVNNPTNEAANGRIISFNHGNPVMNVNGVNGFKGGRLGTQDDGRTPLNAGVTYSSTSPRAFTNYVVTAGRDGVNIIVVALHADWHSDWQSTETPLAQDLAVLIEYGFNPRRQVGGQSWGFTAGGATNVHAELLALASHIVSKPEYSNVFPWFIWGTNIPEYSGSLRTERGIALMTTDGIPVPGGSIYTHLMQPVRESLPLVIGPANMQQTHIDAIRNAAFPNGFAGAANTVNLGEHPSQGSRALTPFQINNHNWHAWVRRLPDAWFAELGVQPLNSLNRDTMSGGTALGHSLYAPDVIFGKITAALPVFNGEQDDRFTSRMTTQELARWNNLTEYQKNVARTALVRGNYHYGTAGYSGFLTRNPRVVGFYTLLAMAITEHEQTVRQMVIDLGYPTGRNWGTTDDRGRITQTIQRVGEILGIPQTEMQVYITAIGVTDGNLPQSWIYPLPMYLGGKINFEYSVEQSGGSVSSGPSLGPPQGGNAPFIGCCPCRGGGVGGSINTNSFWNQLRPGFVSHSGIQIGSYVEHFPFVTNQTERDALMNLIAVRDSNNQWVVNTALNRTHLQRLFPELTIYFGNGSGTSTIAQERTRRNNILAPTLQLIVGECGVGAHDPDVCKGQGQDCRQVFRVPSGHRTPVTFPGYDVEFHRKDNILGSYHRSFSSAIAPLMEQMFAEIHALEAERHAVGDFNSIMPIGGNSTNISRANSSNSHPRGAAIDINVASNMAKGGSGNVGSHWEPFRNANDKANWIENWTSPRNANAILQATNSWNHPIRVGSDGSRYDPMSMHPEYAIVTVFIKYGFDWGIWAPSNWDYMHFSYRGG